MDRYLMEREKRQSRDLWEEAFPEDSKSFDDYYFNYKTEDNRILASLEPDGRVVSMIHRNPYVLRVRQHTWQVDYLVGVATRKEKRHQGYMRRLLVRMMADMRQECMPFCFLMPADEAIYRPFGFTYIYRQPQWRLRKEAKTAVTRRTILPSQDGTEAFDLDGAQVAEVAAWMERWLCERYEMYAVRDEAYLRRLLKEIASENGSFDLLCDGSRLVGVASEWGWSEREQRLLYAEDSYMEEAAAPKPAIMARVISPDIFVKAVHLREGEALRELRIMLRLIDPLIPENDGMWIWELDRETSRLTKAKDMGGQMSGQMDAQLTLTITELTSWLCGYEAPAAAGAYAPLIDPVEAIFLDEVV